MDKGRFCVAAMAAASAFAFLGARHRAVAPSPPAIVITRSLVVTDPAILSAFGFDRVMQTLVSRSGTSTTPLQLYRQWFDTQNPKPGLAVADAPHCDDFITNGKPSFNGFPRRCPTPEGILAKSDPFTANDYTPIAITNRFDLTPVDGSNCGQYRIIYAKTTARPGEKLHIIFEPFIPNPDPSKGVDGCRSIAQFWTDLSSIDSVDIRRERLEEFFFGAAAPAIDPSNFAPSSGRIRTLQLAGGRNVARYYQFHLEKRGSRLLVVPGLLENMPSAPLFDAKVDTSLGPEFRQFFLSQVPSLAIRDVNGFFANIPATYLIVESDPEDAPIAVDLDAAFRDGSASADGQAFATAIGGASSLKPPDVIARLTLQGCTGCHTGGRSIGDSLQFPVSLNMGAHVDEGQQLSPALRDVFAPNRARILAGFLAGKPLAVHSNATVGGGRTSD